MDKHGFSTRPTDLTETPIAHAHTMHEVAPTRTKVKSIWVDSLEALLMGRTAHSVA